MRRLLVASFALVALLGAAAPAQAASTPCPGTFTVLHDDRIGSVKFPAGRYELTISEGSSLSCSKASSLFARFLQDFDGDLPRGWKLLTTGRSPVFANTDKLLAFRVSPASSGGGGGGGGGGGDNPTGRERCPATFEVLNNDRIGNLRIPAGNYVITVKDLSCKSASKLFRKFLNDVDGDLGGGWRVRPSKAKFQNRASGESFRIKRAPSD